jgi:hypothetical protein
MHFCPALLNQQHRAAFLNPIPRLTAITIQQSIQISNAKSSGNDARLRKHAPIKFYQIVSGHCHEIYGRPMPYSKASEWRAELQSRLGEADLPNIAKKIEHGTRYPPRPMGTSIHQTRSAAYVSSLPLERTGGACVDMRPQFVQKSVGRPHPSIVGSVSSRIVEI